MRTLLGLPVLLVVALAGTARADDLLEAPRPRQGYWLSAGAHAAMLYGRERGDGIGPTYGWQGTLRGGQLLTERLGLGLVIDVGSASGDDQEAGFGGLALEGQVELVPNLSASAAIGLAVVSVTSPTDDDDATRGAAGAGYTAALRYDWFPSPRRSGGIAITPVLSVRFVPGDTDVTGAFLGVEITRWTGLPRNQLDLQGADAYKK